MPSKVEVGPSRRLEKFCQVGLSPLGDRATPSATHQPSPPARTWTRLHLTVGTTDDELFERIIVSLPVALVARQLRHHEDAHGPAHFLIKTLPKVGTEMALCVPTYNIDALLEAING